MEVVVLFEFFGEGCCISEDYHKHLVRKTITSQEGCKKKKNRKVNINNTPWITKNSESENGFDFEMGFA